MAYNRINKNLMLPYQYTRGSFEERQRKAAQLCHKFYNSVMEKTKKETLTLQDIKSSIISILPKKVRLGIIPYTEDPEYGTICAQRLNFCPYSANIESEALELCCEKDNKVSIMNLPYVIHEFRHFTDSLFHPKILARDQRANHLLYVTGKDPDELYETAIYTDATDKKALFKMKLAIKKFFAGMKPEYKIDYLQNIRYKLITENNAYYTQYNYAKKMNKKHIKLTPECLIQENPYFMFEEKIALLKDMIYEIIMKERAKHAQKIKNCKDV
ncbi:hypothetical protein HDR58_07430 [bacterium]|nr:hypothetical protein [bacterium]